MRWVVELLLVLFVVFAIPGVLTLAIGWAQWGKHTQRQGWRALAASHGGMLYDPGSEMFGVFGFMAVAANLTLDLTLDGVPVRINISPSFVFPSSMSGHLRAGRAQPMGTRHATRFRADLTAGQGAAFETTGDALSPALQNLAPAFRSAVIRCDGQKVTAVQPWVIRDPQLLESGARLVAALARGAR